MIRLALATLALTLGLGTPAPAANFSGPLADWMTWEQAVAKVPASPGDITMSTQHCPGSDAWGCADTDDNILYLAVRSRFAAYHELGHFYDARVLNNDDRAELKFLMHIPQRTPWEKIRRARDTCGDKDCPSEMFADAYANCALGNSPAPKHHKGDRITGGWETAYGYSPTPNENRSVCSVIRAAGA